MHPTLRFAPPPRRVPLSLRVLNFFNIGTQIGWGVFGFGMIFFWVFAGNADFSFINFRDPSGRAFGKVTNVSDTGASENRSRVRASAYEFSFGGDRFEGKSYTTGSAPAVGDEVTIEFDEDNPERSRIQGMRRGMFGPFVLFVSIFPLVGLGVLIPFTLYGRKKNRVLRNGILTTGKAIDVRPTNVRINNQPVWEVVFEFHDRNGQRRECSGRSTDPTRMQDEENEPLLYDPENPSKAYVIDEAPARPKFDLNGDLEGRPTAAGFALIVPGIVIAANALIFAVKYF